jgi:hypothetical protein
VSDQLDRIEQALEDIKAHLAKLNGQVASHAQTLYGVEGRGGMLERMERFTPGMTSMKTVYAAVGAITSVAAVIVALVIGLT